MTMKEFALAGGLALAAMPAWAQGSGDFFEVVEQQGNFSTLVTALRGSDATWFLEMNEPYTLFAPTNEAFDNLPDGVLDALMTEENRPKLNAILERHVLADQKVMAADLSDGQQIDPATGEPLSVSVSDGQVTIQDATVTQADIATDVGVIHAIDTVLVPDMVVEAMKYREEWPENE